MSANPSLSLPTTPAARLGALLLTLLLAGGAGACAGGAGGGPTPSPSPARTPTAEADTGGAETGETEAAAAAAREGPPPGPADLPPIPRRRDSLHLEVIYPGAGRLVRPDSNFIFGSVGTGDARLRIDGHEVEVEPNGAYLAWLPVPEAEGGSRVAHYRLVAWREGDGRRRGESGSDPGVEATGGPPDSAVVRHPVRRPRPPYRPPESGAWIDSTSLDLPGLRWAGPDERMTFSLRASPEGRAWLLVGEERFILEAPPGSDRYRASVRAGALERAFCRDRDPCLRFAEAPSVDLEFATAVEGDTARLGRELRLRILDPIDRPVVELEEAPDPEHGRSGRVVGRTTPYGPYAWRFPVSTRAEVTGRTGDRLRLAVPGGSPAWVTVEDAVLLPEGTRRPRATAGDLQVEPRADRLRLEIPLASAVPVTVDRPGSARLEIRLHGVRANTERIEYGPTDPLLDGVRWTQGPGPATVIEFQLSEPLWGYDLRWVAGSDRGIGPDAGSRLVLEIRRPPAIDAEEPLRGRTVAVDPGHPGGGAYGPSGYYEGDANLAIARKLTEMLREAGARPVLIRDDTLQMGLYERTNRAVDAGAEIFVSIHNNALPDGVRPFGEEGTSTYYYHPHARGLAASVQSGILLEMGLRDLGIFWGNLAVARLSWMPSVLAEGAFMMMPRHEAALKTPEFQRAYARGVLKGIRGFLAKRAEQAGGG